MFPYYLVLYWRFCHDRGGLGGVGNGQQHYELVHNLDDLLTFSFTSSATPECLVVRSPVDELLRAFSC